MLSLKEFLAEECRNIRDLLNDTLRHVYGISEGKRFYDECLTRVQTLEKQAEATSATELDKLRLLAERLSSLSSLITRIERSHIGEFSWPFAEALKKIGIEICRQEDLPSPEYDPLFFISADGGLWAYSISFEPVSWISLHAKNRIFNIVFPRSLRHDVLLHPILGHEIGHAAYSVLSLSKRFDSDVIQRLVGSGPISSTKALAAWLKKHYGIDADSDVLTDMLYDWQQEYFCDLFGLLSMGPSFICAHHSLLRAIEPVGDEPTETHPPKLTRYWMINVAVEHLKWRDHLDAGTRKLAPAFKSFHDSCIECAAGMDDKFKVFEPDDIRAATDGLVNILTPIANALYQLPPVTTLERMVDQLLVGVPPSSTSVIAQGNGFLIDSSKDEDFRSILCAGWLAWHGSKGDSEARRFFKINRLCDVGIMHSQAVSTWNRKVAKP